MGILDNSRDQEPPETPAPVFALRAFKSALFGTPGADDNQTERVSRAREQPASRARDPSISRERPSREGAGNDTAAKKVDAGQTQNTMASPTKSILVTPGTISNRRKTVSFGDGVVDNERKQESPSKTPTAKTPPSATGSSTSRQWTSGSSDGSKPRSKLTQALMDSRDKRSKDSEPTQALKTEESRTVETTPKAISSTVTRGDDNDETINMDDPRSQSGKYWKTEFDNYRTRTDTEIRRLVQYRSVAKAYARKKDEEAVRLAEKLNQEEGKVGEMERRVSQLASTMVAEGSKVDKEQLIQDLTKQTALALQYKHRVTLLRKALEQHGVVNNEVVDTKEQPNKDNEFSDKTDTSAEELRKTQQALDQANSKIEAMRNQRTDLTELQDLAQSSEQKASELEKENATLKLSLARVKSEMTKYEDRRKEKEAKLKQREAKLEMRIQEYRDRLKTVSQQHRDSQESLKKTFVEERQAQEDQIARLKLTIATLQRIPDIEPHNRRTLQNPRKGYTGVQIYDFGSSPRKGGDDETEDIDEPPSPSPRSKERHYRQLRSVTDDPLDLKRAAQAMGLEDYDDVDVDGDDPLIYAEEDLPPKTRGRTLSHHTAQDNPIPPSSPPDLSSLDPSYYWKSAPTNQQHNNRDRDDHRTTYLKSRQLADLDQDHKPRTQQRRRSPTKYGLDALAGLTKYNVSNQASKGANGLTDLQLDSLPVERILAAQARLKRKETSRKGHEEGKENIKALNV